MADILEEERPTRRQGGSLESSLAHIPGLSEYLAMKQYLQNQGVREQAIGLQNQFIQEREALGPNASPEQLIGLAQRYSGPQDMMRYGQQSQDRKDATAARLQMGYELAQFRFDNLQRQREADLARVKSEEGRQAIDAWYKDQSLKLKEHQGQIGEELKRMGLAIQQQNADTARDRADRAKQGTVDKSVQQLGTALERANLPQAEAVLRAAEESIANDPDIASYISGPKSLFPDAALPKNITDARQAFQKLFNITLKDRSGAAVTNQELERLKSEFATGAFKKPEQLKAGLEQARGIISQHYRSVAAGYGPETLNAYNENLRATGGTPLLEPVSAPREEVPATANIEAAVKRAGWSYEPSKYEYRINAGKVQRKKK